MSTDHNPPLPPAPPARPVTEPASADRGLLVQIEAVAGVLLSNRFLWLVLGIAGYFILQLCLVQQFHKRFHENVLGSLLCAVCEFTLLAVAVLLALSTPAARKALRGRFGPAGTAWISVGLGAMLVQVLTAVLLIAAIDALTLLPRLRETAPLLALTVMQRVTLLCLTAVLIYGCIMGLRFIFRLPWLWAGVAGIIAHFGIGYYITNLSSRIDALERLNDLFYYNALQTYLTFLPQMTRRLVYNNIETPYFGYYILATALLACGMLALWTPFAESQRRRETRSFTK